MHEPGCHIQCQPDTVTEVENRISQLNYFKNHNSFLHLFPFLPSLNGKRTLLEVVFFLRCFFTSTVCPSRLTKKVHFHIRPQQGGFLFLVCHSLVLLLFLQDSGQVIPLIVESCIRFINLYGKLRKKLTSFHYCPDFFMYLLHYSFSTTTLFLKQRLKVFLKIS